MISRLSGLVASVRENVLLVVSGDLGYEVSVPASLATRLSEQLNQRVTLHTIQQFEGNPAVGHLIPRLYGFDSYTEREFAQLLTRVKGISLRKALRIMSLPLRDLAAAIARADTRLLVTLPDIGKKTATELVSNLRELMPAFASQSAVDASEAAPALNRAQQTAVEILTTWGERPAEAHRWVSEAVEKDPALTEPDEIVSAAYRVKAVTR